MSDRDFYRALEECFRASRDEVIARLQSYQPFWEALQSYCANPPQALDIGCGRGEWLEVLTCHGFKARGVDLDEGMLAACFERGLDAELRDGLEALRALPDNSLNLISAFHVVEHLPFDYVQALLKEAHRVLALGGLLILETPNSENLTVGTSSFYLDPTHHRPVPARFLDFLCQYSGFERRKILGLQEDERLHDPRNPIGIWQVLYGVSPDYALVAQKTDGVDSLAVFEAAFSGNYGLTLEQLAKRHDLHLDESTQTLSQRMEHIAQTHADQLGQLDVFQQRMEFIVAQHAEQLQSLEEGRERGRVQLEQLADACEQNRILAEQTLQELQSVYNSTSWKITRPLRQLAESVRRVRRINIKHELALKLRYPILYLIHCVRAQPKLWCWAQRLIRQLPWLEAPLRRVLNRLKQLSTPQQSEHYSSAVAAEYAPRIRRLAQRLTSVLGTDIAEEEPQQKRPKLAYVSPLPPERTGIADYSAELLPALAEHFSIDVIVQQPEVSDPWIRAQCPVRNAQYLEQHASDYQAVLYHVGNSGYHAWMMPLLERVPGILVLHDFYLSGLIWALDNDPDYVGIKWQALHWSHGYSAVRHMVQAEHEGAVAMHYPFNRSVLDCAQGIIVHADISLQLAQQWYGSQAAQDWIKIPHLRCLAEPSLNKAEIREYLGLPAEAFVVCSFGLLGVTKLNHRLLNAWLDSALAEDPQGWLVFVGALGEDEYAQQLRQQIAGSLHPDRIRITGWTDTQQFKNYLKAADVAVQLRTLSRGEASGTVLDCMSHGLATIVNAHGSMVDLPEEAVHRLVDDFSQADLVIALEYFWRDPEARFALGQRARTAIAQSFTPEYCAALYQQAIHRVCTRVAHENALIKAKLQPEAESILGSDLEALAWANRLGDVYLSGVQPKQLLVDITATVQSDRHTGIERVARALTLALLNNPPEGVRVEPVYLSQEGGFWHYRYACAYSLGLLGLPPVLSDFAVDYSSSDQLIALDISGEAFIQASHSGLYQELRARGITCRMLVHDVLPVTAPQLFPPQAQGYFDRWLRSVALLQGAVCVSRHVATELQSWLQKHALYRLDFRIDWSHHGADLSSSAPTQGMPEEAASVLAQLERHPSILMVGTLEPRKGYRQVLEAFNLLWQRGIKINLVLVGREGWTDLPDDQRRDLPELMACLKTHPEQGRHLFWLNGISDEYLERLYQVCDGLLAASWDEGFGLPLIEAAQHQLPILARDIPVFREVAGAFACYFHAEQPKPLADAILDWLEAKFQPASSDLPWLTWHDSATRLKTLLIRTEDPTIAY